MTQYEPTLNLRKSDPSGSDFRTPKPGNFASRDEGLALAGTQRVCYRPYTNEKSL
jgi:hypothetical protein